MSAATALLRFRRRAMATQLEVILPWVTPRAEAAAGDALDLIDRLEAQLSAYRPSSELCRLNRIAAQAPMPVELRLFKLLEQCERLSRDTGGAFDITTGPLIRAWGFFERAGRAPSDDELAAARASAGMVHVALDPLRRSVRFDRPGVEINLGSIGKGYALDRAAELLRERWKIGCALLDGGTSSVLAVGVPPECPEGWEIGLRHPWQPRRVARIWLRDRALATSGAKHQHFAYNDRKLGHVLDPRSGRPAEGISLAAVLAPSAAEADALATAFYVLGRENTEHYCSEHPTIGALLLLE